MNSMCEIDDVFGKHARTRSFGSLRHSSEDLHAVCLLIKHLIGANEKSHLNKTSRSLFSPAGSPADHESENQAN